jgi:hypothetical protein
MLLQIKYGELIDISDMLIELHLGQNSLYVLMEYRPTA